MSGEAIAQRALPGVVADAKEEVEVVQPARRPAVLPGACPLGLFDEVASPSVGGAVSEGTDEPRLVLRPGHQGKRRVDAHAVT